MNTGFIYKITDGTLDYYGSTDRAINTRLTEHKQKYKLYLNGKYNYVSSFEIIKNGHVDIKIELIEEFNYNDKNELLNKEKEYILNNKCCNQRVPNQTPKEYYMRNRERILRTKKEKYHLKKINDNL